MYDKCIGAYEKILGQSRKHIQIYKSLGHYDYHGILNLCGRIGKGVCVGNSSSGIKETSVVGCPAVNIGPRQKGRLRVDNVIDVGYNRDEILDAVRKALYDGKFRKKCRNCKNPYGTGNTGEKIANVLATIDINLRLLQKKMTY